MPSPSIQNINETIQTFGEVAAMLSTSEFQKQIKELNVSLETREVNKDSALIPLFLKHGYLESVQDKLRLTRAGVLFYSRLCIDFEQELEFSGRQFGHYLIVKKIRIGKNSATDLIP